MNHPEQWIFDQLAKALSEPAKINREIGKAFDSIEEAKGETTADDMVSRLDLVRYLEGELQAVRSRINPSGAFYHQDQARLMALRQVLEFVEEMEGQ